MRDVILVGFGGFLGSIARYALGGVVTQLTAASRFPFGTLVVNLLGCFVMGIVTGYAERTHLIGSSARLFLMTGLLGGFTTYSAFAYESYFLGREQALGWMLANIALHVVAGLGVLWLGHQLVSA
jgi:fluoride exporter